MRTRTSWEHYFIPIMLIMVSLECILAVFYSSYLIIILGVIGLIFGSFFLLIRVRGLENSLYPNSRRMIHFSSSLLFLIQSSTLFIVWVQIDAYTTAKIAIPIFIFLSFICGLSMILKTIDPNNSWNLLDPPLNKIDRSFASKLKRN